MIRPSQLTHDTSIAVSPTEPRQTPPPASRRFAEALERGMNRIVQGAADVAVGSIPGGAILAAATREAAAGETTAGITTGGGAPEGPGVSTSASSESSGVDDYRQLQQQSQEFNLQFLQLQEGLSQENRRFSALSNVLKARHDTSKAVIQNIR